MSPVPVKAVNAPVNVSGRELSSAEVEARPTTAYHGFFGSAKVSVNNFQCLPPPPFIFKQCKGNVNDLNFFLTK